jgi:hypothetical protein
MIKVQKANEATKAFIRKEGWTGADGVYQHRIGPNIYWYFSDTFIGKVEHHRRVPGYRMVHHSFGVAPLDNPFQINFIWPEEDAIFHGKDEGYHWLLDGIRLNGDFYLNTFRIIGTDMNFAVAGVDVFRIPIQNDKLLLWNYQQVDLQHHLEIGSTLYSFGIAILDQRAVDGYIYVFGVDHEVNKHLVVYKTMDFLNEKERLYLSPYGWEEKPTLLKELASPVANELKVIHADGLYHLVFSPGGISDRIIYASTPNIEDGFYDQKEIYKTPEYDQKRGIICYNAKLQVLNNHWYVSYHVNASNNDDHVDADIYRPRFLKILKRY